MGNKSTQSSTTNKSPVEDQINSNYENKAKKRISRPMPEVDHNEFHYFIKPTNLDQRIVHDQGHPNQNSSVVLVHQQLTEVTKDQAPQGKEIKFKEFKDKIQESDVKIHLN